MTTKIQKTEDAAVRDFGTTGMKLTSIGLGTWNMERDPESSLKALKKGIEQGSNHIDTAEMYGRGEAEKIVAQAVKGMREKVFLVSKVLPENASYAETMRACERSLTRLGTDHLDCYLLHWRNDNTPIEETFKAFEKLKDEGKIRSWGVSNFDVNDMIEAVRIAGEGKIACNQVLYHLNERAIEFDVAPWCISHEIAVVGYSPLGQGHPPEHPILDEIAQVHGVTTAQVALAFLTRYFLTFTIPKSSNPKRTEENVKAMKLRLTEPEIEKIETAFPARKKDSLPMI